MDWRTREMEARQRGVEAARRLEPGTVPEGDEARAELANERLLEDLKDLLVGLDGDPEARYVLFQDLATTYVAAFQDEAELVSASHAIERLARDNPDWAMEPTAATLDLIERVERLAGEAEATREGQA